MLKDITLGQYFPGNSIAHKLDPRTKILLVTLYIIALFSAKGWMGYAVMAVTLAACVKVSHVGLRALVRGLKPLVFIIAFTGILNMFFTPDTHYLWEWGILRVSVKGIENALFMVIRIMLLVMGTFLMTYTTSPIRLTDGLESLLNPLKKIHVPVHELAMMMAIALRFIPTLIEETDKIMSAQKARGADFDSGNIFQKAKALVPILVPLFISAFRRADELVQLLHIGSGGRAGHGDGVPLLPRRRGPHQAPRSEVPAAGLRCSGGRRGHSGAGGSPAEAGRLKTEKLCRHKRCKGKMLCVKGAVL